MIHRQHPGDTTPALSLSLFLCVCVCVKLGLTDRLETRTAT